MDYRTNLDSYFETFLQAYQEQKKISMSEVLRRDMREAFRQGADFGEVLVVKMLQSSLVNRYLNRDYG